MIGKNGGHMWLNPGVAGSSQFSLHPPCGSALCELSLQSSSPESQLACRPQQDRLSLAEVPRLSGWPGLDISHFLTSVFCGVNHI